MPCRIRLALVEPTRHWFSSDGMMPEQEVCVWLNGKAVLPLSQSVSQSSPNPLEELGQFLSADRALHYGHGLFETMTLRAGRIVFFELHMARLSDGLGRLLLPSDDSKSAFLSGLAQSLATLQFPKPEGLLKVIVSAGQSQSRGYASDPQANLQTIVRWSPLPDAMENDSPSLLRLMVCGHRLPHQPTLAGLKHLNRLDQVLTATEVRQSGFDEGIVCDIAGYPIEATASNLFIVQGETVVTPCLSQAGVAGVLRKAILNESAKNGFPTVRIMAITLEDIYQANEVFITNMVRGVRPVGRLSTSKRHYRYAFGPVTQQIRCWFKRQFL